MGSNTKHIHNILFGDQDNMLLFQELIDEYNAIFKENYFLSKTNQQKNRQFPNEYINIGNFKLPIAQIPNTLGSCCEVPKSNDYNDLYEKFQIFIEEDGVYTGHIFLQIDNYEKYLSRNRTKEKIIENIIFCSQRMPIDIHFINEEDNKILVVFRKDMKILLDDIKSIRYKVDTKKPTFDIEKYLAVATFWDEDTTDGSDGDFDDEDFDTYN